MENETLAVKHSKMELRKSAWIQAGEMLDPIIDKYGIDLVNSGPMFVNNPITPVDQHIEHVLRVAEWLLTDL